MRHYPAFFSLAFGLVACEGTQRHFDSEPSTLNPAGGQSNGAAGNSAAGNGAAAEVSTPPGSPASGVEGQPVAGRAPGVTPMCEGTNCSAEAEAADALPCNPDLGECAVPCAGCTIAGECVGAGSVNGDNACQICDPARGAVGWSNNDDASCNDGLFCTVEDRCTQGACGGTPRECDDTVACNGVSTCEETTDTCSPPENQCGAGDLCDAGTGACVSTCPGCNIGGVCLTSGAEQAGNPCQVCDPVRSSTSYSAAVGKACGAAAATCSQQDTCDATGSCQPNHLPAATGCGNATSNTCNQPDSCDGNGTCLQRLIANGTPCEDGLFCTVGDQCSGGNCTGAARTCEDGISCNGVSTCDEAAARCTAAADQCGPNARCDTTTRGCTSTCAGCVIGGTCVQTGAEQPGNPCLTCDPSRSATAFSLAVGKACGQAANACSQQDTCGANGACQPNHLAQGTPCGSPTVGACNQPDTCDGSGNCQTRVSAATPETCDGVDNDCDGEVDEDLEPIEGVQTVANRPFMDVAPAANGGFRVVTLNSPFGGGGVFTGLLPANANGSPALTQLLPLPLSSTISHIAVRISAGNGDFATAHIEGGRGGSFTFLGHLNAAGALQVVAQQTTRRAPGPALAFRRNLGDWIVVESGLDATGNQSILFAGRYSATGVYTSGFLTQNGAATPTPIDSLRVAAADNSSSAAVWRDGTSVVMERINAAVDQSTRAVLAATGSGPSIASVGNDFGVAWATEAGFQYRLVSSAGVARCNPTTTEVVFGDGALGPSDAVAVASASNGNVYVLVTDSDGVGLFRLAADCALADAVVLTQGAVQPSSPRLAVSGNNVAATWTEAATASAFRVVSTNGRLCQQ